MSCSSCLQSNPCGCKKRKTCDECPVIDWVPNTACTIGVTWNGCTDTLELRPGIQNCETKTHMTQNPTTGCIEYQNELYVATNGVEGYIETICPVDIAKYINLEDLANVEDTDPENCALLVYKTESDCGPGCTGAADTWVHWYASEHLTNGLHWVAGFNSNGCLEALDVPPATNKYWWGMWRPTSTGNGTEFGYIQPTTVNELPKDASGKSMVLSQDANGKPIYGPIDTTFSLCSGAYKFQCRGADYHGSGGFWRDWQDGDADTTAGDDDFLVVPDGDDDWRAPTCGVMMVCYCINVAGVRGDFEVNTTLMNSDDGNWSISDEERDSTHSTWAGIDSDAGVSESCTAFAVVSPGQTLRLHARAINDTGTTVSATPIHGFRIHAVKALFIPLERA